MVEQLGWELKRSGLFRKHAYVDLASEMDVTKALTLTGETVLDKPMKVEKAKIKSAEKAKISAEDKKGVAADSARAKNVWQLLIHALYFTAIKDSRCLYLKNVPYSTTKEDLMRIFKAVDVRFPGGTKGPTKG